jgi:hypothetical protein
MLEQLPLGAITLRASGEPLAQLLAEEQYRRPIEVTFHVDPSGDLELRHPLCNMPLLREIARASSGLVLPPTGLAASLDQIDLEPERLETITKKPLWNRWDLFWIFIACLSLEWLGRKLIGLH